MNLLDIAILFISCMVEIYIIFDFYDCLFELKNKYKIKQIILYSIASVVVLFGVNMLENAYLNLICVPLIMWTYISILFQTKVGDRLVYFIVAFSIFWGCEFLFVILLSIPTYFVKETSFIDLSSMYWQMLSMKLLTYMLFVIIKQIPNKSKKRLSGKFFLMYLCVPIASLGIMLLTYYSEINFSGRPVMKIFMTVCFTLMLLGNILVYWAFNRYSEELYSSMQQKLLISRKNMEQIHYEQLSEINKRHEEFIHNTSHYLKAIGELAKSNRNENIINIISELNIELDNAEMTVYCGNLVLNAILVEKKGQAEKKGICFDIYVEPGTYIGNVSDADLITMMGNLLDNAIRAADSCSDQRSIQVRIFMQNEGNFCVVKIVNNYCNEIKRNEKGFASTKDEKGIHGIGIHSVEKTAEKNNGYLECIVEKNVFTAILILSTIVNEMKIGS